MDLKEIKQALINEYCYQTELHAHTSPVSGCSQITPKMMAETYCKLGFSAVTIANHFQYHGPREKESFIDAFMKDYNETKEFGEALGLKIYLAAEIRFTENDNDYLIYGITRKMLEEIYDLLPFGIVNFRKNYKMPDSLFIQAHPFRNGMEKVAPELLDGIEAYNLHPNHNSRVGYAAFYAKENGIEIVTAGTDFHHPERGHEGLSALRSKFVPEDGFELVKLLKSKDYILEAGMTNIIL